MRIGSDKQLTIGNYVACVRTFLDRLSSIGYERQADHAGRFTLVVTLVILGTLLFPVETRARVRLENICSIYGQKEVKLTGIGLIVGLKGTGDGRDNLSAMRALGAALKLMNAPVAENELKNAKNIAMVLIEATIPKTGLRRGQKIDCYVSSPFGAKSLRGGRLLVTPVETAEVGDESAIGLASGAVLIEDADIATSGKIPGGIVLEEDALSLASLSTSFIDKERGHVITLLLDSSHSSFHAASEVARVVNAEFSFEASNQQLARPTGPGVIEVRLPKQYHESPVEFIAQMLEVGIENPHTQARVVVNAKTGTVIVTGEVEISPVVISHKNFTVEVGQGGVPGVGAGQRFVEISDQGARQSSQQLKDLVEALNQLRVPTTDIINIIRELHRSGKLHAVYDEH